MDLNDFLLIGLMLEIGAGFAFVFMAVLAGRKTEAVTAATAAPIERADLGVPIASARELREIELARRQELNEVVPPPPTTARPDLVQCFDADGKHREWVRAGSVAHRRYQMEVAGRN